MNAMIYFHRLLFAAVLMSAFALGAVNAARAQLLQEYGVQASLYLSMSLSQLSNVRLM